LAINLSGTTALITGEDGQPALWNLVTGVRTAPAYLTSRCQGSSSCVDEAAYSPDGRLLAVQVPGSRLEVGDTATGRSVPHSPIRRDAVQLAFAAGGRLITSISQDGIHMWNVRGGAEYPVYAPQGAGLAPQPVAITGDQVRVLTQTGTVLSVDVSDRTSRKDYDPDADGSLLDAAGRILVNLDIDPPGIDVRDTTTGRSIRKIRLPGLGNPALSGDGKIVAIAYSDRDRIDLWNLSTGRKAATIPRRSATLALDRAGRLLATNPGTGDAPVQIWATAPTRRISTTPSWTGESPEFRSSWAREARSRDVGADQRAARCCGLRNVWAHDRW
jgi:WD40 repeat protein